NSFSSAVRMSSSMKNAGPFHDHTPATGSVRPAPTIRTFRPSASIVHNACRFQNKIDFESGENRGANPPSLIRSRLPPDEGIIHIEMAPPRAEEKAIERPSGDQSAVISISSASVTRSALPL